VQRCHLSENVYGFSELEIVGSNPHPRFDVSENFLLKGVILGIDETGRISSETAFHLPPHWIAYERRYDWQNHQMIRVELPMLFQNVETPAKTKPAF
jgi:hypothetical protein